MKPPLFLALAALLTAPFAHAESLEALLQRFDADPASFMNEIPKKKGPKAISKFSAQDIAEKKFIAAKNANRKLRGRAEIQSNDLPEDLVDNGSRLIRTLEKMESKNLLSASIKTQPWSDHYWALYTGQTAFRYADENFPNSDNWKKNADYILGDTQVSVNSLSPAEKYDLLIGSDRKNLTNKALSEGEEFYRSGGEVESWMGICHGWAIAAYMEDRPKNAIKVLAADGQTKITFYPSDIKALTSLLWAKHPGETKFIGGRCDVKNPKKNSVGRIEDENCFDTNPGAWHMAVVNQIGVNKRSMVIDATFDFEVWNHPVQSYSYQYFNPQTLKPVDSLEDAKVAISEFSKDKFKKFRSDKAAYVVGISMDVTYMIETMPSTNTKDKESDDASNTASYQYDLELDEDGKIIGGEWYNNTHPDFLWTATPKAKAITPGDKVLDRNGSDNIRWDGSDAFPSDWTEAAKRTAQGGSPLATVVQRLLKISNGR